MAIIFGIIGGCGIGDIWESEKWIACLWVVGAEFLKSVYNYGGLCLKYIMLVDIISYCPQDNTLYNVVKNNSSTIFQIVLNCDWTPTPPTTYTTLHQHHPPPTPPYFITYDPDPVCGFHRDICSCRWSPSTKVSPLHLVTS